MTQDLFKLGQQVGLGGASYSSFQQQMAIQQLQFGLQQAIQTANTVKQQTAQAGVNAGLSTIMAQLTQQDAITAHKKTVAATRYIQDFNNQISDRNRTNMLLSAQELEKSMVYNAGLFQNIAMSRKGSQIAEAAGSGTVAGQGTSSDLIYQTLSETKKEADNQLRSDKSRVKQAYENALSIEISKSFDNWNTETQIDFSNQVLKNNIY